MEQTKESNWDRLCRESREMDKDQLIKRLLMQMAKMRNRNQRNVPLWSFVGEATNHGSGYSSAICHIYGVDSDTGKELPA